MTSRPLLAIACLTTAAAIATGCGAEVPSNSVAKVGGDTITKAEFSKWLKTAAMGQSQGGAAVVPDPPNFTQCVAQRQRQPAQKGTPKPNPAQLKTQCKSEYDRLKGEVMQFLIQAQWVQQEAEERDVKVSNAEVKKSFDDQKKQAFPTAKEYDQFLKTSGMNEQDILFRVRLDTLQNKLTQKITEDEAKVTDQEIKAYYDKNKKKFSQPERRDLAVVLTKKKGEADQAKRQLDKGASFKTVARRSSIDDASKAQGGKLPDVTRGSQEKGFEEAVFAAKKGQVSGPVKTQFGFYVFEVTKIEQPTQQTLEQAKGNIKNLVVAECKDAPKQSTGQQGAPQQGVPQGGQGAPPSGGQQVPQQGAPPQAPQQGAPQQVPQQGVPQQAPQGGQQVPQPAPQPSDPAPQGPASP